MKRIVLLKILLFFAQSIFSQIEHNVYDLNSINNLLTDQVKKVIDENTVENKTIFLGEAVHYSGSDFLAKAEFVKYLVSNHGYKDIAFESDFFALLFDHKKKNLYRFWSQSKQCEELFTFLEKNNVTLWGFDNQLNSNYSNKYFTKKLGEVLLLNNISLSEEFIRLTKSVIKNQYKSRKLLKPQEIAFLMNYVERLLSNNSTVLNSKWRQILLSFKSAITLYTIKNGRSDKKIITIRDKQMAQNLNFLINHNSDKKFIVWLANGHMSKLKNKRMGGQTMGFQFRELNTKSSYHIAMGSMVLPPRNEKEIKKASKNKISILSLLPSISKNYFIDTREMLRENSELRNKIFDDSNIFNLASNKTELISHFDALVLIAQGEEVKYE